MAPHSDHGIEIDSSARSSNSRDLEIPVLIVGGGPTGLLLAHMLSRFGGKTQQRDNSLYSPAESSASQEPSD